MSRSTDSVREIQACEVCGNAELRSVLDLGHHPLCDDLVPVGDSRVCREYPIEILLCRRCLTAHQRFQVPKRELFPSSYHYRSRFTADVLRGMQDLVAATKVLRGGLAGARVVDVGCNDGSLLDFFRGEGAVTIGVEPTGAAADARGKGHAILEEFFTLDAARRIAAEHGAPDIITFTNVFAHIEDLAGLLEAVRALSRSDTILVIENHYLGAVLARDQFDTFYHEHPRTYSYTSFVFIARTLGLAVRKVEFPSRYGGNIRVFLGARPSDGHVDEALLAEERRFADAFQQLNVRLAQWREVKGRLLREMAGRAKLSAKAFPGRAAILVKLLGLDEKQIEAVYEKPGSMKIGHYVPGTRIPIRSDAELMQRGAANGPLLNLAWHIPDEIRRYMAGLGFEGPIVDVVSESDFRRAR